MTDEATAPADRAGSTAAELRETFRHLAEFEDRELPVLSVYLDVRPEATGQRPARRAAVVVLRDRLREIEETYWPRGRDYDSFAGDRDRLQAYLGEELDAATEGLAVFACSGRGLWEVIEAGVPFRDSVAAGPRPELFQLARLLDEHDTAVVALVDSNTARLFVTRAGSFEEVGGPDEDTASFRKRSLGGWSQARYQRHIDKHIEDFARETAVQLDELAAGEEASRVILAGDEVAITPLQDELPQRTRDLVADVVRIGIRAGRDEVAAEVRPVLDRLEAEEGQALADQLVGQVRAGGLGVMGLEETRRMLETRAVDTLVLLGLPGEPPDRTPGHDARALQDRGEIAEEGESGALDLETREELVRLAAANAAAVEVVNGHDALERAGGVGALLRFRPD